MNRARMCLCLHPHRVHVGHLADVRQQPEVVLSADSWMGAETSGWTFRQPVRVTAGATLRVWQGATVTFAGGLVVEPGASFVCEPGATCVGAETR